MKTSSHAAITSVTSITYRYRRYYHFATMNNVGFAGERRQGRRRNNGDTAIHMAVAFLFATLCREMRNTKVNIEELQTFVEVANAGGISSAALRLGVSKSIVSRRLLRLEEELGVQLLARSAFFKQVVASS